MCMSELEKRNGFLYGREHENPDFPFMDFQVAFIHSMSFVFIMYCPWDNGIAMFDRIAEKIEDILSDHHFNVHNVWLIPLDTTNEEGKHCHDFPVAYELTQIVDKPTCVPNTSGHHANLLHLQSCQMFCWSITSLGHFIPITDQCETWCQTKGILRLPFHRKI